MLYQPWDWADKWVSLQWAQMQIRCYYDFKDLIRSLGFFVQFLTTSKALSLLHSGIHYLFSHLHVLSKFACTSGCSLDEAGLTTRVAACIFLMGQSCNLIKGNPSALPQSTLTWFPRKQHPRERAVDLEGGGYRPTMLPETHKLRKEKERSEEKEWRKYQPLSKGLNLIRHDKYLSYYVSVLRQDQPNSAGNTRIVLDILSRLC